MIKNRQERQYTIWVHGEKVATFEGRYRDAGTALVAGIRYMRENGDVLVPEGQYEAAIAVTSTRID